LVTLFLRAVRCQALACAVPLRQTKALCLCCNEFRSEG